MGQKTVTALAAYDNGYITQLASLVRPRRLVRQRLTDEAVLAPSGGGSAISAFGINRSPDWLVPACDRIVDLVELSPGWDGHDGKPVDFDVAAFAIQFLLETLEPEGPGPVIVPLSYGGLQLEWHEQGIDLEIEIEAPNKIFVSFEDQETGRELEREFSTDYTEVTRIMQILALRSRR